MGFSLYNQTQISVPTSTLRIRGIVKGYSFTPLWSTRFAGRLLPMMLCIRVCHQLFFFNHRNNNNQIPSKRLRSFSCNACCLACVVCPWSCKLVSSQFHRYTILSVFPTVYRKGSLLSRRQSLSEHYRAKLPTTESESKLMTRHSFM